MHQFRNIDHLLPYKALVPSAWISVRSSIVEELKPASNRFRFWCLVTRDGGSSEKGSDDNAPNEVVEVGRGVMAPVEAGVLPLQKRRKPVRFWSIRCN